MFCTDEQYQTFLKRVQSEYSSEYPDIESILTRYHCLVEAHKDLMQKQQEVGELNENSRNDLVNFFKVRHCIDSGHVIYQSKTPCV